MIQLFNNGCETLSRPRHFSEPIFQYLNKSAREDLVLNRKLLQEWFEEYPEGLKSGLANRFQSSYNDEHLSSFFELFLYHFFRGLGCEIKVEEELPWDSSRRIDFEIVCGSYNVFLEATVLKEDQRESPFLNKFYEMFSANFRSPQYFFEFELGFVSDQFPSMKKLSAFIRENLARTNYDDLINLDFSSLPVWEYHHLKQKISIKPIPKKGEHLDHDEVRPVETVIPAVPTSRQQLLSKLTGKASRYGTPNSSYIIGVDIISEAIELADILSVLFGHEGEKSSNKVPDQCFFGSADRLNYSHVSAVLIFQGLSPLLMDRSKPILILNPRAAVPVKSEFVEKIAGIVI